jgi:hypothetical protein
VKKLTALVLSFGVVAFMILPLVGCSNTTTKKTETKTEVKKDGDTTKTTTETKKD